MSDLPEDPSPAETDSERPPESSDAPLPEESAPPSRLLDYLRLLRLPNVFTAVADVMMGFLFVHRSLQPVGVFLLLAAASCCLYLAGMVLNDVYDLEEDRRLRPHRPLPSGRIPWEWARGIGYGLLSSGVLLGLAAGVLHSLPAVPIWRAGIVAAILAGCVVLYDAVLKRTVLAPLLMGGCRFFNVLLGMSVAAAAPQAVVLGFGPHQLLAAGGIGLYIVGVTWFARTEAEISNRLSLSAGLAVMGAGIFLLGAFPEFAPVGFHFELPALAWPLLLLLLFMTTVRRCGVAIYNPQPEYVQAAIKHCIFSLIILDAAVVAHTNHLGWALAVLALLVPTLLLGRWIYAT